MTDSTLPEDKDSKVIFEAEEAEELEPLEDQTEPEELQAVEGPELPGPGGENYRIPDLQSDAFYCERRKYESTTVPSFFMDKNLGIMWMNSAADQYFKADRIKEPRTLELLFHPYLNEVRLNKIYEGIYSSKEGYSWTGKFELSGDDRITLNGNMIILPWYAEPCTGTLPDGYFVILDDLTDDNNILLRSIFKSLLEASKLKDNDTGNHIERVNQYSYIIARELYNSKQYPGINMQFVTNIKFLASMHDVGKIGTPDNILNKPGRLTDDEWEIIKEHTINGAFILSSYPDKMAMEIARSHHEKWNGSGYPYGLKGRDIPLSARIVAIADVYDALRMKRSYKESFSHEYAVNVLLKGSGSHFDPELIEKFNRLQTNFDEIFDKYSD